MMTTKKKNKLCERCNPILLNGTKTHKLNYFDKLILPFEPFRIYRVARSIMHTIIIIIIINFTIIIIICYMYLCFVIAYIYDMYIMFTVFTYKRVS